MAIDGHILVTPGELKSQSAAARGLLARMERGFETLQSTMRSTEGFWTGEAGDSHRQSYMAKLGQIQEIIARYREQIADLEVMAGVYDEAEWKAASAADSLPPSTLE